MADKLASLRPLLTERTYDGWAILGKVRSVNATLALYAQSIPALRACAEADELVKRLESVAGSARRNIALVIAMGAVVSATPRQATIGLFELLPEVVSISKDAKAVADRLSISIAIATIPAGAAKPLGPLAPLPTPMSPPKPPTAVAIKASFFGSGVSLKTYSVSGTSPSQISQSMNGRGPYSDWLGGRADGLTQAKPAYRFTFAANASGSCIIQPTDQPPIVIGYTVTLPRWSPPAGTSTATVEWWNDLVLEIATHEKHHVTIYRATAKDLNTELSRSTCQKVQANLAAVWNRTNRQQCEFDMREYGYAIGLSLEACLAQ